jgi:hypothetical protein
VGLSSSREKGMDHGAKSKTGVRGLKIVEEEVREASVCRLDVQ